MCPFPQCTNKYDRLADHVAATHNLNGAVWKPLRHRLLDIAHHNDDEIYDEEIKMLSKLSWKFENFTGTSISIDYLKPDVDQIDEEMLLPVPEWAEEKKLHEARMKMTVRLFLLM